MAAKASVGTIQRPEPTFKKSATSGKPTMVKTSSMNKHKRASYKRYRGQGR